jgi:catechol 2,3-dioxygenase-like lactoylglutathione lyase family enzyme
MGGNTSGVIGPQASFVRTTEAVWRQGGDDRPREQVGDGRVSRREQTRPSGCPGLQLSATVLERSEERRSVSEHTPAIDFENLPAPSEGFLMTQFITVRSVARSRAFYSEVLGGQVVMEENPCMIKLSNSWLIMNPGGGPTPDKPDISVVNYEPGDTVSSFMNLRVADIQACYEQWSSRGAEFVTPPIDRGAEIRCYMRDPDGYMIEVGQSTGLLEGKLAKKRPEDLPG